jgi:secreted Zn-dependent insulinase-like peptidase
VSLTEEGGKQSQQVLQLVHQFSKLLNDMSDDEVSFHKNVSCIDYINYTVSACMHTCLQVVLYIRCRFTKKYC